MGVSEIDPEGSGSMPETAKPTEGNKPDIEGSNPTLTQNELIILVLLQVLPTKYLYNDAKICFCLKGECFLHCRPSLF